MIAWITKNKKQCIAAFASLIIMMGLLAFMPEPAFAQADTFGLEPIEEDIQLGGGDIRVTIAKIIRTLLSLLGIVAVAIVIYGGVTYMTAGGDSSKLERARKILINGVIGLVIILMSWTITQFVLNRLQEAIVGGPDAPLVDPRCSDPEFFRNNRDLCTPGEFLTCEDQHFVVKSLTPSADETNMNNVAIRAIFSKPLASSTDPGTIFTVTGGGDIELSTEIIGDDSVVEAVLAGVDPCFEDQTCLTAGTYRVEVNADVTAQNGDALETETDCGDFPRETRFSVNTDPAVIDTTPPTINNFKINGDAGNDVILRRRSAYPITAVIEDDATPGGEAAGTGYVRLRIFEDVENGETIRLVYDGPRIENGSADPFLFEHNLYIPRSFEPLKHYIVEITAHDIDHNVSVATSSFTIVGEHCDRNGQPNDPEFADECLGGEGGECSENWQCVSQICDIEQGRCIESPIITDVDPWDGASRNWITVTGAFFGNEPGEVAFGIDGNGDGDIEESDIWVPAAFPACGDESTWNDEWVIAEVPEGYNSRSYEFKRGELFNFVQVEHTDALAGEPENGKTIALWVQIDQDDVGNNIIRKEGSFVISQQANGLMLGRIWEGDQEVRNTGGRININAGEWHHVALVADPATDEVALFVDGQESARIPYDGTVGDIEREIMIGARTRSHDHFDGFLDDIRIYNRALSVEEVALLAANQNPEANELVAHWKFDEADGAIAFDSSGNEHHGTHFENNGGLRELNNPPATIAQENRPVPFSIGLRSSIRITRADDPALFDTSSNDRGPIRGPHDGHFLITDQARPGLCRVETGEGATAAEPGTDVIAIGQGFSTEQDENQISFGNIPAPVNGATETTINSAVPQNIQPGEVAVRVLVNGEPSNGVPFTVLRDSNNARPNITSIDPNVTTRGSYITITGTGFGSQPGFVYVGDSSEHVRACAEENNQPNQFAPCEVLDVSDLAGCEDIDTWSGTQIVAAIPEDLVVKPYAILVKNNDNLYSDGSDRIDVIEGAAQPSICGLVPATGPAPLREGADPLEIRGANLGNAPTVYYWQRNAVPEDVNTWLSSDIHRAPGNLAPIVSAADTRIQTLLPTNELGVSMDTGPIRVQVGDVLSNAVQYTVLDCTNGQDAPGPGFQCCAEGPEAGQWKPENFVCAGENREAAYLWRFTTGKIPNIPRVIESCDIANWDSEEVAIEIPSPSPWDNWDRQNRGACINSMITVRFSHPMADDRFRDGGVRVFACGGDNAIDCDESEEELELGVDFSIPNILPPQTLLVQPLGGNNQFNANTWYRVELADSLTSEQEDIVLGQPVVRNVSLLKTRPCGSGTAYCFEFKTRNNTCTLAGAGIAPGEYTTNDLGLLLDPRNRTNPFYYLVWGRADQECIAINVDQFDWNWNPVEGSDEAAYTTRLEDLPSRANATALRHTAPESVALTADTLVTQENDQGDEETRRVTGNSELFINLRNPQVNSFWPNCAESCTNAVIGVAFNRYMAVETYNGGITVQRCGDELCTEGRLQELVPTTAVIADDPRQYVVEPNEPLDENAWYLVSVSTSIKALEQLEPVRLIGESVASTTWKFRTKEADGACLAEFVRIDPHEVLTRTIGEKTVYESLPYGAPDECSPYGQQLDPWDYGWNWSAEDVDVATISTFESGGLLKPYCGFDCTPAGSHINRANADEAFLCGNGVVEPGEDCDIAVDGEVPGQSCSFSCLRPGSSELCGNGIIDIAAGEECDPDDPNSAANCDANLCIRLGSPAVPPGGDPNQSWCGSGEVTVGEDCDIALLDANPINLIARGCTETCLHAGTRLAAEWCTDDNLVAHPEATILCRDSYSVCGNGVLEQGEECEIIGNAVAVRDGQAIANDGPQADICNSVCLLQNLCDVDNADTAPYYCDAGEEGCREDCVLDGSSIEYSVPSLCADGETGIGEFAGCEISEEEFNENAVLGQNPVQVATAIGQGAFDPVTKIQETTVTALADTVRGENNIVDPLRNSIEGEGTYELQCGYVTYNPPRVENNQLVYNNCSERTQGVANNSCCYERSVLSESYPVDGDGFDGEGVCRNTLIRVTFNGRINYDTVRNNIFVARGYEEQTSCSEFGEIDITNDVRNSQAIIAFGDDIPEGFFARTWWHIKRLFARVIGTMAHATEVNVEGFATWCSGRITAEPAPNALFIKDADDIVVGTTIGLHINALLDSNAAYAVVLRGGEEGIRDSKGVGIMSSAEREEGDAVLLDESIVFRTGNEVCKIADIYIDPSEHLFIAPNTTSSFRANVESTQGTPITSIPNQYAWEWSWGPQDNTTFNIPVDGSPADEAETVLGATTVEGEVTAFARARVVADADFQDSHLGRTFAGTTELRANFCERPWPLREYYPYEDGNPPGRLLNDDNFDTEARVFDGGELVPSFIGGYFNFSMDYCADAGRGGETNDDLPFLEPFVFAGEFDLGISQCGDNTDSPGAVCETGFDCYNSTCSEDPNRSCSSDTDCFSIEDFGSCLNQGNAPCGANDIECLCELDPLRACQDDFDCQPFESFGSCEAEGAEPADLLSACQAVRELPSDILKRWFFFNDKNDDVLGIQIFQNPDRLNAYEWYRQQGINDIQFSNIDNFTRVQVDGYDAITDGNNYYINALNKSNTGQIYNNIYHLTINPNAQPDTRQVFTMLLESLKFNINISDIGYCLLDSEVPGGLTLDQVHLGDFPEDTLPNVSDVSCRTDFDCLDAGGEAIEGTAGVCSNARTKFLRDWSRLEQIQSMQQDIEDYAFRNEGEYPALGSGTFVPQYTNSRWPSWGFLAGTIGGNLALEEINNWTSCGVCSELIDGQVAFCNDNTDCGVEGGNCEQLDGQTCWNAQNARYVCPAHASIYEYEYVTSTRSYLLHGPLEYFNTGSNIITDDVLGIDTDHFTTDRWCAGEEIHTPFGSQCGDGIVNRGSEVCDPPGERTIGNYGYIGGVDGGCNYDFREKDCATNVDCPISQMSFGTSPIIAYGAEETVCMYGEELLYGEEQDGEVKAFSCTTDLDCRRVENYGIGQIIQSGNGTLEATEVTDALLTDEAFGCAPAGDAQNYGQSGVTTCTESVPLELATCDPGYQAVASCNDQCDGYDYGRCETRYACGNGIVEGAEVCDDGRELNGTFGHCNADCSGPFGAFCGNGEIDLDENNNPLEFCDINDQAAIARGFCGNSRDQLCTTDDDCTYQTTGSCAIVLNQGDDAFCPDGYANGAWDRQCTIGICGNTLELGALPPTTIDRIQTGVGYSDKPSVCTYGPDIIYDKEGTSSDGRAYVFGCNVDADCRQLETYTTRAKQGNTATVGLINVVEPELFPGWEHQLNAQSFADDVLNNGAAVTCTPISQMPNVDVRDEIACPAVPGAEYACTNNTNVSCTEDSECENLNIADECLANDTARYHDQEQYSCAPECRGPGEYCGDGIVQRAYEEVCDDGNRTSGDGCDAYCQLEETVIPEAEPAPVDPEANICGDGVFIPNQENDDGNIEVCDLGDQNGIPCVPGYNESCTYCSGGCDEILTVDNIFFCGNGEIEFGDGEQCDIVPGNESQVVARVCEDNLDQLCTDANDCAGVVGVCRQPKTCGPGGRTCEVNTDCPLGIECSTNEASPRRCSNNDIFCLSNDECVERCVISDEVACSDVGQIACNENCTEVVRECKVCGLLTIGGADPVLFGMNPMVPNNGNLSAWAQSTNATLLRLDQQGNVLNRTPGWQTTDLARIRLQYSAVVNNAILEDEFNDLDGLALFLPDAGRLEADQLCADAYALAFNYYDPVLYSDEFPSQTTQQLNIDRDVFRFPVTGEFATVQNDYIISPAVPQGVFRIVMRWTGQEQENFATFIMGVHNDAFGQEEYSGRQEFSETIFKIDAPGEGEPDSCSEIANGRINIDVESEEELLLQNLALGLEGDERIGFGARNACWNARYRGYWWPGTAAEGTEDALYFHKNDSIQRRLYTQAITVDPHRDMERNTFAVYVRNIGDPIADFKRSNLEVEIYEFHEGQDPAFSIYEPVETFSINAAADTSSNVDAQYWHVLNLEFNRETDKYEWAIVRDGNRDREHGSIETEWQDVLRNIPQ